MAGENVNLLSEESFQGEDRSGGKAREESQNVFLCHSGKQKNFVRRLYRDLINAGVSCFFDEDIQSLPLTQEFPPRIFRGTETCKLAVLILSKEFFPSKWPMQELSAFFSNIGSGKNPNLKILPIFYKIAPNYLSQITVDYPQWQELGISEQIRAEWQKAVSKLRSINGLKFSGGENEVSFREKVVSNICSLLPQPPPSPLQQAPKRRKVLHLIQENLFITTAHHNTPCSSTWFPFFNNFVHLLVVVRL